MVKKLSDVLSAIWEIHENAKIWKYTNIITVKIYGQIKNTHTFNFVIHCTQMVNTCIKSALVLFVEMIIITYNLHVTVEVFHIYTEKSES